MPSPQACWPHAERTVMRPTQGETIPHTGQVPALWMRSTACKRKPKPPTSVPFFTFYSYIYFLYIFYLNSYLLLACLFSSPLSLSLPRRPWYLFFPPPLPLSTSEWTNSQLPPQERPEEDEEAFCTTPNTHLLLAATFVCRERQPIGQNSFSKKLRPSIGSPTPSDSPTSTNFEARQKTKRKCDYFSHTVAAVGESTYPPRRVPIKATHVPLCVRVCVCVCVCVCARVYIRVRRRYDEQKYFYGEQSPFPSLPLPHSPPPLCSALLAR